MMNLESSVDSADKLQTLRAHRHRRVASNPFPIFMMENNAEESSGSGGDSDMESVLTTPGFRHITQTPDANDDLSCSAPNTEYTVDIDTFTMQTLEIADLCHSPTLNRRSVSIFNFCEELEREESSELQSPKMAAAFLNKIHRSFTNLTSTSSMESIGREDYRALVLREILDTERTYLSSLDTLVSVFLPALEELVSPRELRLLFPCQLEPLMEMHRTLFVKLEERIEGISQWHGIVGDIFGRLCSDKDKDFISVYSAYMNEFKVAMQTLIKYQNTSPLFRSTTNTCIKQHNLDGLNLSSFLLTPIQRLPRYELLLKQLMKHTPEDHPDTYYLEAAMDSLHSDLTMLDKSIQACQFASTVSSFKDEGSRNKRSAKKHNRSTRKRHQSSRFARIKRHFSQANMDDFASLSQTLEKNSSFSVSEWNIMEKMSNCDSRPSSSLGSSTTRAISCSEVHLLDSNKTLRLLSMDSEGDKDGEFGEDDERTPCMSHSSSINSHDSIIALNKRVSIYSNNSSNTSGFDSLMLETDYDDKGYNNTLRPVQAMASTSSNDSGFKDTREQNVSNTTLNARFTPTNHRRSSNSKSTASDTSSKKKTTTISSAFKVIRRASKEIGNSPLTKQKSTSSSNLSRLNISDPLDFRHIQHGFSNRPVSIAL